MREAKKLKAARQLRGLSAIEVAERVGVDRTTIYRLEEDLPQSVLNVISIVKLYGLTPNDIFLEKDVADLPQ